MSFFIGKLIIMKGCVLMEQNTNENTYNRRKVNYKNYKDLCEKEKLTFYPRGAERNKQIKELEVTRNIFKKADNSFTKINEEYKNSKKTRHDNYEEENTITVGNHSVYLGTRKYYFDRFKNMKALFLDFILNADENIKSKSAYVNRFFSSCYCFFCLSNENFNKDIKRNKGKRIAFKKIVDEFYTIFNQFLKLTEFNVNQISYYIGYDNEILDSEICQIAEKEVYASGEVKWYDDNNKRYEEINKLLNKWEEPQISYKFTKYYVYKELEDSEDKCIYYKLDMTRLYEILRYKVINDLDKITQRVRLGYKNVKDYELNEKQFKVAKAFVEEFVCYYDEWNKTKHYSEEDIF